MLKDELNGVLDRSAANISEGWTGYASEIPALYEYIKFVSSDDVTRQYIDDHGKSLSALVLAGRRIGENGLETIIETANRITSQGGSVKVLFSEPEESPVEYSAHRSAKALALDLRKLGYAGEIIEDLTARNTGDQVEVAGRVLEQARGTINTVIVAASLDHVGRMMAATADAVQHHGLLATTAMLPLPSGRWHDRFLLGFTLEELAFSNLPERTNESFAAIDAVGGQYTFRWIRSLHAKAQGKYLGRSTLSPTEMLGVIHSNTKRVKK